MGPGFGQAQKCGRVKPVNVIPTIPFDNWGYDYNPYINMGNTKRGVSPRLKFDPVTLTFDL